MKKASIFYAFAAVSMLMTGCAKEASNANDAGVNTDAIKFGTYLGRDAQTKGTVFDQDSLKHGFGASAFYTGQLLIADWHRTDAAFGGPNFMRNQKVSYNATTGNWEYSPIKYWPTMEGDKITFFAYAPYATQANNYGFSSNYDHFTNMNYSLLFTLQKDADRMVDFVAAAAYNQTFAANGNGNKVVFNFIHTLSRISFSAKTSEALAEGTHIVLRNAELLPEGFYRRGMYYFYNNKAATDDAKRQGCWMHMKGENYSLGNSFNDNDDDNADNSYDLTSILNTSRMSFGEISGKEKKYESAMEITGEVSSIFKDKADKKPYYLFLIPAEDWNQDVMKTDGLADKTAAVKFTYDIVTVDNRLATGYSCTEATKTVYLPAGILRQGKARLTMSLSRSMWTRLRSLQAWKDGATRLAKMWWMCLSLRTMRQLGNSI